MHRSKQRSLFNHLVGGQHQASLTRTLTLKTAWYRRGVHDIAPVNMSDPSMGQRPLSFQSVSWPSAPQVT
jgi:hypothetical protein